MSGNVKCLNFSEGVDILTTPSDAFPPKIKTDATTAPGLGDDSEDCYSVGSWWFDTTNSKQYTCLDASIGAAVWKEVIDQDSTQTFANKKFDSPIHVKQSTTPANPASGYNKLYFKSDNKIYTLNSSGTEVELKTDWLNSTSNKVFASDAAFVAAKGAIASDGDCYLNSADNLIHFYIDSAWRTQAANIGDDAVTETKIANGSVTSAKLSTGHPDWDSSSNFKMNSGYGSNAITYGCRAWVNFKGSGTVEIRESGNVSSITDNGVGDYTVNFTTAMPDANYAAIACDSSYGNNTNVMCSSLTKSDLRVTTQVGTSAGALDLVVVSTAIFR